MTALEFVYAFLLGAAVGVVGAFVCAFWVIQSMRERGHRKMRR